MKRLLNRNPFARHLVEMAKETEREIVEELAPSDNPECELCGAKKFQTDQLDVETKVETYITECAKPRCDGDLSFSHFYLAVGDHVTVVNHDFGGVHCSEEGCEVDEGLLFDVIEDEEPYNVREYTLPVKGIVTTAIHEHHTNYPEDETITVCAKCHNKIHRDDDFRPDLRPEISWKEWQEMND